MEEDELTAEEEERLAERLAVLAAKIARNNSRLDALDSRMQQGFAALMTSISSQQTTMDDTLMRFKKLDGALVQSSANPTQASTASTITAPPSLATSSYPPPLSSLPRPPSSLFPWSVPPNQIPPPTQLSAIPSVSLGKPLKTIVSPIPQPPIPNLPLPPKLIVPLCPVFSSVFPYPILPNSTSLGSTAATPTSASFRPIPALDPGVQQEVSHPDPDEPVDELEEDPPPALDPGDYLEIYVTNPADPLDELVEEPPPALDPGDHRINTSPLHSGKLGVWPADPPSSLPRIAEKVFDGRQAQGGGRLFYSRRATVGSETNVLIMGAGPIDFVPVLAAHAFGAPSIVIVDIDEHHLSVVKAFGDDVVVKISPNTQDVDEDAVQLPQAMDANIDVCFACAGFRESMSPALNATHAGGKGCLVVMVHAQAHKLICSPLASAPNFVVRLYVCCGCLVSARRLFESSSNEVVISWASIVHGHARSGWIDVAKELFDLMPERNAVSWSAMIIAYPQTGMFKDALEVFNALQVTGVQPNHAGIVGGLFACVFLGAWDPGKWIHVHIARHEMVLNRILGTALMDLYAMCGCIDNTLRVCVEMPEFLVLFGSMESEGTVIRGIFPAIRRAWKYVDTSWSFWHFDTWDSGCSEYSDQAVEVIRKMPVKPDRAFWRALLNSCKTHGHSLLSQVEGKKLSELEPSNKAGLVVFENARAIIELSCGNNWQLTPTITILQLSIYLILVQDVHAAKGSGLMLHVNTWVSVILLCMTGGEFLSGHSLHGFAIKCGVLTDDVMIPTWVSRYACFHDFNSAKKLYEMVWIGQQCAIPHEFHKGSPAFHLEDKVLVEGGTNVAGIEKANVASIEKGVKDMVKYRDFLVD